MTEGGQKCCGILTLFKYICVKFLTLIIAAFLFFLIPLLFILISLPCHTFRYLLSKSAKWIRPDLEKMVTIRGTLCAIDNLYKLPKATTVIGLYLEGNLDIERLKITIKRNLFEDKLSSNGKIKYPELKQYLTSWMGYYFWKEDKTFDLDRHVTMQNLNGFSTNSDTEVQQVAQTLLQKPWTKNRPVWEINLLPNCYLKGHEALLPHTILFLRFHHTLGDGYSMLRLITEGLAEQRTVPLNVKPTYSGRNYFESVAFWAVFPFKCSYHLARVIIETNTGLPFTPDSKTDQSDKSLVGITDKIPIGRIKEIKNHFGVNFSGVVNALCTGAMRDFMIMKGINVPEELLFGAILPLRGHSEKLRNYILWFLIGMRVEYIEISKAAGIMRLCTGEPDPVKRLQLNSAEYQRLKYSVSPILSVSMMMIVGSLPAWVMQPFYNDTTITTSITNFSGGFDQMSFEGCPCVDTMFVTGIGPLGVLFCVLSYTDGIRISPVVNGSVMSRDELNELIRLIQKHLDILHEKIFNDV